MIGEIVTDLHMEYLAIGDAFNVAVRVLRQWVLAPPFGEFESYLNSEFGTFSEGFRGEIGLVLRFQTDFRQGILPKTR